MPWRPIGLVTILRITLVVALTGIGWTSSAWATMINLTPTNGVNSDDAVSLGALVSGQVTGITVGDKVFTGFSYSRIGDMPLADNVNVLGFRDPDGNWGISLHGTFIDLPGGDASDALVRFEVEVEPRAAAQGLRIHDAHLFLGGVGVGEDSFLSVDESFLQTNQLMNVFRSTINGDTQQLSDWVDFDSLRERLFVTKDIFARADNDATQPVRATVIDQSFSQVIIPEPTSVALMAVAVVGLTVGRRRRHR